MWLRTSNHTLYLAARNTKEVPTTRRLARTQPENGFRGYTARKKKYTKSGRAVQVGKHLKPVPALEWGTLTTASGAMLTHALVRPPSANFAHGLTRVDLGKPDVAKALEQHARYCSALERCGLVLTRLAGDADFPDSTFVEDTAIVTGDVAILTRPGAAARAGEVARIEPTLRAMFSRTHAIAAPGTLDGGDVCQVENHCFIGLSERTNEEGARQLAGFLAQEGCTSTAVDIRGMHGILHLKSGVSYLGDGRVALIDALAQHTAFRNYEIVQVVRGEGYAANLLRLNDHVIIAAGFPGFEAAVRALGYDVIALDMSEFRKMDGALTCLSLRF